MCNVDHRWLKVAFFMVAGSLYSGWAYGAEGEESATPIAPSAEVVVATPAPAPVAAADVKAEAPARHNEKLPDGQSVNVGTLGQVELHVKDVELTQVLQLLSIQAQKNIVATRNVSGQISADLYGVDFYQALEAILSTNGFGYREKGNFIYVYTAQELRAMADAERKTVHRVFRLNYINAADAAAFITPLKSPVGSISLTAPAAAGFQPSISDGGGNSYAHADTLIVSDYPENIDQMGVVLKDLDVRPKQVLVEATVLEASLSEDNGWGVDLTILANFGFDSITNTDDLMKGNDRGAIFSTAGTGADLRERAGFKVGVITDSVAAFISALDEVTDTTVLAKPKLLVLNRQKANLLVGDKIAYLSTTATESAQTQTVEFLDTGTKLTLRPFISDDGFIRMELKPSISTAKIRNLGTTVVPDQTTEELTTNVMVRNGQTVILGGLFKESTTVTRRQVPFLGDVPLLGAAFKGQDDAVRRSEVIFMVTPTIVKDESMVAAADRVKDSIELAQLGARQELLPWSRSKLTSAHLREAQQYLNEGRRDKALWSVNMALSLDPTLLEARRLREQITGQRERWPETSVLKDSIERQVELQMQNPTTRPSVP